MRGVVLSVPKFIRPTGSYVINVRWLNQLEILVLTTELQHEQFVKNAMLQDDGFANDWKRSNGSCSVIEIDNIPYFVLLFREKTKRVVVHECVHMVHYIFDEKGIPVSVENSEAIAYMTDFLSEQVFGILGI